MLIIKLIYYSSLSFVDVTCLTSQTRWAWGTEEKSALELNVAPRVNPTFHMVRVAALVLCVWAIINGIVLTLIAVPIPLGRLVLSALCVPTMLRHDPLHFIVGSGLVSGQIFLLKEARDQLKAYAPKAFKMQFNLTNCHQLFTSLYFYLRYSFPGSFILLCIIVAVFRVAALIPVLNLF
jgi:hypothetical protein